MDGIPRIKSVEAVDPTHLRVRFENDVVKLYDFGPLLSRPEFFLLRTPAFFRAVRVDPGGYGISWNDNMDLSEDELWTNGTVVPAESVKATL